MFELLDDIGCRFMERLLVDDDSYERVLVRPYMYGERKTSIGQTIS